MIGVLVKRIMYKMLVHVIDSAITHIQFTSILIIKIVCAKNI